MYRVSFGRLLQRGRSQPDSVATQAARLQMTSGLGRSDGTLRVTQDHTDVSVASYLYNGSMLSSNGLSKAGEVAEGDHRGRPSVDTAGSARFLFCSHALLMANDMTSCSRGPSARLGAPQSTRSMVAIASLGSATAREA